MLCIVCSVQCDGCSDKFFSTLTCTRSTFAAVIDVRMFSLQVNLLIQITNYCSNAGTNSVTFSVAHYTIVQCDIFIGCNNSLLQCKYAVHSIVYF